jgi:GNAT superfamily N-acetyltransferase
MITEVNYTVIEPIWNKYLWPGRKKYGDVSGMQYMGGYHTDVYIRFIPLFFAYYVDGEIVGVNSGHCSTSDHFRSRGLYVFEKYRKMGIGTSLLKHTIQAARDEGCSMCWSLPRQSALSTYLSAGFVQTSEFVETETSEQNCFVMIKC